MGIFVSTKLCFQKQEDKIMNTEIEKIYGKDDPLLNKPKDARCEPDPRGMGCAFLDKFKEYSDKICQIDAETGTEQTYYDVMVRCIRVAEELRARGVTSDDVISLCTLNHLDTCVPFIACLFNGIKVASLDPTLSLEDCTYLLKLVKPKMIFIGLESEKLIESALKAANLDTEIVVFGNTENYIPFSEFLISTGNEEGFEATPVNDIHDTAVIFFSSGTTGLPKGIMSSHYGLLVQNMFLIRSEREPSRALYFTTLYWISGVMILIMATLSGGTRILCSRFNPHTLMKHVQDYKVSMTFMAPILTHLLTQIPGSCDYDTSTLKWMFIGGGPIGADQILKLRKLLPYTITCNIYGMTEASGAVTMFHEVDKDLILIKPISCGLPVPGLQYRILDTETGRILGPNKRGELRIKGECLMNGYYNKPEESKNAWDEEGFLITGDVAYYDEDYCFYVVDRIKDLLKFQSWHIAPAEIESVILAHPSVKEAVVIGIPDEVDGDLPMGVVVLKSGHTVAENDIIQYVAERVSDRKRLRGGVTFVDKIPLTPSGKLRRRDLRDMILQKKM